MPTIKTLTAHNMTGDSKHDRNKKITEFTTKISAITSKETSQSPISHKRSISKLSPASPTPSVKHHIMENTTNNFAYTTYDNDTANPAQSTKRDDSIASIEENATL